MLSAPFSVTSHRPSIVLLPFSCPASSRKSYSRLLAILERHRSCTAQYVSRIREQEVFSFTAHLLLSRDVLKEWLGREHGDNQCFLLSRNRAGSVNVCYF